MIPTLCRRLVALVFVLSFAAAASAQQQLNWFWWKSEPTLAISPDQSAQIDGIFQDGIGQLQRQKDELDRLETKLSRLIETSASEAEVTHQIDRVEATRSTLNKTRTLMLLHMRLVLKPEQRLKLNGLLERREQERKALDERLQQERERLRNSPDPSKGSSDGGARKRPH
jgi:Spy/CpxP family protein refolding chaperone